MPGNASVKNTLLIDTGPIAALMNRRDRHHQRATELFRDFPGAMMTTWPVLTEASHLLPDHLRVGLMRWVAAGALAIHEMPASAAEEIADLMEKYNDRPMDLADASLVWLGSHCGVIQIATIDLDDFSVYRTHKNRNFTNMF